MSQEFNADALRPLFKPWEEPTRHRTRNPQEGAPALIEPGRRPSRCRFVPRLRHEVEMWRRNQYVGASDTTRTLLLHWFETAHASDFRYYYCQREAVETVIWLYEVQRYRSLSSLETSLFEDEADETFLRGIKPEEDAWARYCLKLATGSGKTKVMSLAIVWSYFHSLFEAGSDLARHFLVIAPNLIVFERLKDDFQDGRVFQTDPLIPPEWKDSFDLQVILQEEAGGATTAGALYLTNIHRLYERERNGAAKAEPPPWAGPAVSKAQALKVGEALRERIASHPRILVLNDEAHHLHDPDSAWNEAIASLDQQSHTRGNAGVTLQLDLSATPKHNDGSLFRHIVCDFPLGEAVDGGIVKVPVIGKSDELKPLPLDDAAQKWAPHLKLGYKQYENAFKEWEQTRKPILFIMTEDTPSANAIAAALDSDDYPLLKGRVINLHTKLKGKVKKTKQGRVEFVEDERAISDEDLKAIRQLSRDLDKENSPYRAVVSVLMLREGWDVRNVTTIVPLRPYSADSGILPEQTLGRGLRRMTPPAEETLERVTVVEHSAFVRLYEEELAEEGVLVETQPIDGPRPTSVSIFVDSRKAVSDLDIEIPVVSDAIRTTAKLEDLTFEEVQTFFQKRGYPTLPIKEKRKGSIVFEERSLFTDELVSTLKVDRGLLQLGFTAVSVFVKELEKVCRLQSAHAVLAPLLQRFIEEVLFGQKVSLYDGSVDHRMADPDVAEYIHATFTPLVRQKTIFTEVRERKSEGVALSTWKPYQATMTPQRPCVAADRTVFNLAPCANDFESQFCDFLDISDDVKAFAKNAGPQKLMIDYLAPNGRPALYTPDFVVRMESGTHYLVETKGEQDATVPFKARAAVQWCDTASTKERKWQYVFVPMALFEQVTSTSFSMEDLARACVPRLEALLGSLKSKQLELPLDATPEEVKEERTEEALEEAGVPDLPEEVRVYVSQAVNQLAYDRRKNYPQFGGAFQPLLVPFEQLCGDLVKQRLGPRVPADYNDRKYYFDPYVGDLPKPQQSVLIKNQRNLQRNLVHAANCNRIGTLLFCLEFAQTWKTDPGGIWGDVAEVFTAPEVAALYPTIKQMNDFRNKHVAHVDEPLTDGDAAEAAMKDWVAGIAELHRVVAG